MGLGAVPNPTSQQGPPPGITLAPPTPQPPPGITLAPPTPTATQTPPPTPTPAPAPAAPMPPASAWERLRQHAVANMESNLNAPSTDIPVLSQLNDAGRGVAKGAMSTIGGLTTLGTKIATHLGAQPQNEAIQDMQQTAKWFNSHADTHGFWEGLGSTGESVAEFMGGEGLLKLAPELAGTGKVAQIADKLKQSEKVASFLQANPKMAKLIALGMRTAHAGAVAGAGTAAQTYVKSGGDLGQTATGGLLGAAGGAVLSPVLEGAGSLIRNLAPSVERIAGEDVPILRSQITRTAPDGTPIRPSGLQEIAANRGNSPAVAGQQEAAAARTVKVEAQNTLARELNAANETRGAGPAAAEAPGNVQGMAADSPEAVRPGSPENGAQPTTSVDTSDPALASGPGTELATTGQPAAAAQLGDGVAELANREPVEPGTAGALGDGRTPTTSTDTSRPGLPGNPTQQLGAGDPARYKLPPIDVQSAIRDTHDFGDAADQLHASGKVVYDRLNEVTGGQWQAADQRIQSLQTKYQKAVGADRDAIGRDLQTANGQMDRIFKNPNTGISSEDLSAAKRLWRSGYVLRDLHNALEPAYQIDADFARKTGAYRGFNGGMALTRLRSQIRMHPDLRQLIGQDAADNLQQIFHYNVTMAGRQRFGEATTGIARWIADHGTTGSGAVGAGTGALVGGRAGAAVGGFASEGVYQALKLVLHKVATDPQTGKNLLYAIEGGARPENYGPLIGRMVLQGTKRYGIPVAAGAIARSQ